MTIPCPVRPKAVAGANCLKGTELLLNHLIRARQQRFGNCKPQRGCSALVDHELKSAGLDDRQVAGACTIQDAVNIGCALTIILPQVATVRDQTAGQNLHSVFIDGGQTPLCREAGNAPLLRRQEEVKLNKKSIPVSQPVERLND